MGDMKYLNWSVEVPMGAGERMTLSRREIGEASVDATANIIGAVGELYDVPPATTEGMWARAMDINIIIAEDPKEDRPDNTIELGRITPEQVTSRTGMKLSLVKDLKSESDGEDRRPEVKLVTGAVGEEYAILRATASTYMGVASTNPSLLSGKSGERVATLNGEPDTAKQVAIGLAVGRRMLRYGLLPDESIPEGMRSTGFDHWLEEANELGGPTRKPKKRDINMLRDWYVDGSQAAKNLRRGIWPPASTGIIGVNPKDDILFYLTHNSVASQMPGRHRIAFGAPRTTEMPKDDAANMLTAIFSPQEYGLRLVSDRPKDIK